MEVTTDDRLVDIVKQEYDAGIRLITTVEKDMIAVPIGPKAKICVVATPEYLASYPAPAHPRELVNHCSVIFRYPSGRPYYWEFYGPEGKLEVTPCGNIVVDDLDSELEAVLVRGRHWLSVSAAGRRAPRERQAGFDARRLAA
ncbi:LysR substrate binding domain [Cedecea neteri]|uniref:LysR substrate binding domain n=1 Tax=Cedecea neteri TaxID=158822 RepID=A0A2X2T0Z0_9ENTR|nr:LysR substrate binding domain [Cedecea neteri]